jgi:hypothetical protein
MAEITAKQLCLAVISDQLFQPFSKLAAKNYKSLSLRQVTEDSWKIDFDRSQKAQIIVISQKYVDIADISSSKIVRKIV